MKQVTYQVRIFNERRNAGEMRALGVPARWVWGRSSAGVKVSPSDTEAERVGVPEYVVSELAERLDSLPVNTWVQVGPHGEGTSRSKPRPLTREEVLDLERDEAAMRRYARGMQREEAEWHRTQKRDNPSCVPCGMAENPLPSSAWSWLIGGAVVAGAAWLYLSKKESGWNCRAGMRCTHFVKDNSWQAKNLLDNSLAIYSTPPDNFKDLTLEETAPDGSYHVYDSIKSAVMTDGLPEYTP